MENSENSNRVLRRPNFKKFFKTAPRRKLRTFSFSELSQNYYFLPISHGQTQLSEHS